jgi:23S rRNA pseudouridine1911/1915/1917 synthase
MTPMDTYHLLVPPDPTEQRLDRWLAAQLPDLSRSRLQKLIEQGQILLNQHPCVSKSLIKSGDEVVVQIPAPVALDLSPSTGESAVLDILYEDEQLIVINKPVGMVVHPAPGHSSGTLVHALLAHCSDLSGINGVERPGIVHRLDKDTSGVLVVAKTDLAHQSLQAQIQAKTAQREYLGIVWGAPKTPSGVVDAPIGRHPIQRKKMAVVENGRPARTHWQVLERIGNYSLLGFRLETGRTHQIRVHSFHMGHPVLADPLYGHGKIPKVNVQGQVLHAYRLQFIHPVTQEKISCTAPLPDHWLKLLRYLRNQATILDHRAAHPIVLEWD